ncbi:DUF6215 domain-containing protein [Streptomyces sp. NPDC008313]|uniref:DUF6215 domain-containing protein n=1 Tax=Streptomyces sp. NPDC008313 TaxID=3364826 RepID=UPI0036E6E942
MLGLIIRLLPFWVREPLLILVGSVFGVGIMMRAALDGVWGMAALGAVLLVVTALRVRMVHKALRARRNPAPAEGAAPGAPAHAHPQPQPVPVPSPAPRAPEKHNAWGQAFAAVAVFGAIGGVLWLGPHLMPSDDTAARNVSCPDGEHEKLPAAYRRTPQAPTGEELCKALNRPGLAGLLGTPGETATTASGTSDTAPLTDGKVAQPEAEVKFDTYTVNVSATYNDLSTARYAKLMTTGEQDVETLEVLGRPAVFSSGHTMQFEIDLGSEGSSGPVQQGPPARTLTVALDRKDRGGYYDITVWSEAGFPPDDSVLVGIAEKVLPAVSGHA